MTADIVNLRQARKRRGRADAAAAAAKNRATFGISKAARELASVRRAQDDRRVDGHRRGPVERSDPDA